MKHTSPGMAESILKSWHFWYILAGSRWVTGSLGGREGGILDHSCWSWNFTVFLWHPCFGTACFCLENSGPHEGCRDIQPKDRPVLRLSPYAWALSWHFLLQDLQLPFLFSWLSASLLPQNRFPPLKPRLISTFSPLRSPPPRDHMAISGDFSHCHNLQRCH